MGIHGAAAEQLFSAVFGPGSGLTPSMKEMDEGEVGSGKKRVVLMKLHAQTPADANTIAAFFWQACLPPVTTISAMSRPGVPLEVPMRARPLPVIIAA
jgi:hypothetical protein